VKPPNDAAEPAPTRKAEETPTAWHTLLPNVPSDSQLARPPVIENLGRDVLVAARGGAETGAFIFTGIGDRVGMPLPLFDRYLAALGVTAVYLKDFRRLLFMNGIVSLGGSYERTLVALHNMVNHLGIKRLCTIGYSGGGRPAILYGVELGAERILTFASATGRTPCLTGTPGGLNQAIVSRRTLETVAEERLDLKPFLTSRRHSSSIDLYYAEERKAQEANALYLSDLPGVTVRPVAAGIHHSVLVTLANEGDFVRRLAEMLGVPIPA
jgi:hypothetical protein